MLTGRADPEVEAPVLWPPHEKRRLPGKDPDVGKDGGHKEKGTTEDEMVGQWSRSDWPNCGGQWRIGVPGVLWSMGSRRVGHN